MPKATGKAKAAPKGKAAKAKAKPKGKAAKGRRAPPPRRALRFAHGRLKHHLLAV